MGALMIIDLHSWEAGYADGQLGRALQCPDNLDGLSYSSGYCEGRAAKAGKSRKAPRLRYVPSAIQRRLRHNRFDDVG
jgi:hypothetical protein